MMRTGSTCSPIFGNDAFSIKSSSNSKKYESFPQIRRKTSSPPSGLSFPESADFYLCRPEMPRYFKLCEPSQSFPSTCVHVNRVACFKSNAIFTSPNFGRGAEEPPLLHKSSTPPMLTGIMKSRIKKRFSLVFDWLYHKCMLSNKRSI